jgi:hypothetical protein
MVVLMCASLAWATNIAPLATPSADSTLGDPQFSIANLIDGSLTTYWASSSFTGANWYRLMWGTDVLIDQVKIDFVYPTVPEGTWDRTWKNFNIKALNLGATDPNNPANWTTIVSVTNNVATPYIYTLPASVQTKALQVDILTNYGFPYAMAYELSTEGTVVPEPVSLVMLLAGLGVGLARRVR